MRAILATPSWQRDAHDCYLKLSSAVICKAGEEWLAVERWLKGHGNGEA